MMGYCYIVIADDAGAYDTHHYWIILSLAKPKTLP
jgi:hypothetical protein